MPVATRRASRLTIGVVGPHELVERIMLADGPDTEPARPRRMVAAPYRDEQESPDKVARLGSAVDSWLFASPVPLALARAAGVLRAPATTVPLGGSALYAALVRAYPGARAEPPRASVDLISAAEVTDALTELGLPTAGVHVRDEPAGTGNGPPGARELADFHEQLWRGGATSAAFTCLPSVAARLAAAGLTAYPVLPTGCAIRAALRTALLLAANRQLERAQLTVIAVEVPVLRDQARGTRPWPGQEELRLAVHRLLVQQARGLRAWVSPAGDHCFLVTATAGALAQGADWPAVLPFAAAALAELGVELDVGVGTGVDAQEAAARARAAARPAASGPGRRRAPARQAAGRGAAAAALTADTSPEPASPAAAGSSAPAPPIAGGGEQASGAARAAGRGRRAAAALASARGLELLARLAAAQHDLGVSQVVDAQSASQLLGVTPRTARRLLGGLAEEGLAWPLPPSRSAQPGRPRQLYRLLAEKLPPQQLPAP